MPFGRGGQLHYRGIQVGLSREAAHRYADEWVRSIEDIIGWVREVEGKVRSGGRLSELARELPAEAPYPVPAQIASRIAADDATR